MKKLALITTLLLQSTLSLAQIPYELPLNCGSFQELIVLTQKTCPTLDCPELQFSLESAEIWQLPAPLLEQLRQAGVQIAENIWDDTILEGPYEITSEKVHLEKVEVVLFRGYKIGYRITYSNRATDVDNDIKGRIIESGFVSDDFSQIFRDEKAFARFEPN